MAPTGIWMTISLWCLLPFPSAIVPIRSACKICTIRMFRVIIILKDENRTVLLKTWLDMQYKVWPQLALLYTRQGIFSQKHSQEQRQAPFVEEQSKKRLVFSIFYIIYQFRFFMKHGLRIMPKFVFSH